LSIIFYSIDSIFIAHCLFLNKFVNNFALIFNTIFILKHEFPFFILFIIMYP